MKERQIDTGKQQAMQALHLHSHTGRESRMRTFKRLAESLSLGFRGGATRLASSSAHGMPSNHLWFMTSCARPFSMPMRFAGLRSSRREMRSCGSRGAVRGECVSHVSYNLKTRHSCVIVLTRIFYHCLPSLVCGVCTGWCACDARPMQEQRRPTPN